MKPRKAPTRPGSRKPAPAAQPGAAPRAAGSKKRPASAAPAAGTDQRTETGTLPRGEDLVVPMEVDLAASVPEGRSDDRSALLYVPRQASAEEALRQSREDLARAQAVGKMGWWRLDVRSNRLMWSDESYRIFGAVPGSPQTYESFLAVVHPEDRGEVHARWQAALKGDPYDIEHRIVVAGQTRWVREKAYLEFDADGRLLGGFGITQDITDRKHAEETSRRLNRTLHARSLSDAAMMRATEETAYLQEVCRIITEDCKHAMVWIGFAEDDAARTVRPVAWAGFDEGYLAQMRVTWADTPRGRGPTGRAIREGRPIVCRDMLTDPGFAPWRKAALQRGYAASVALPLRAGGRVLGALTIYSRDPDPFTDDEVQLLSDIAGDLAFGITTLRVRRAEQEARTNLQASEERLRLALEAGDLGTWDTDCLTGRTVRSPRHDQILGYPQPQEDWSLETAAAHVVPEDRERFLETRTPAAGRTDASSEVRIVWPDGSLHWVSSIARFHYDEHGRPLRIIGLVSDITERKRAEEDLFNYSQRLAALMDALPVGVSFSEDASCRTIKGNPALLAQFEIGTEDNISASAQDALAPGRQVRYFRDGKEIAAAELPLQRAVAENREIPPMELEILLPSGKRWFAATSSAPFRDRKGNTTGGVAVTMDITDRKKAEQALETNRRRLELLATVAQRLLHADDPQRIVNELCALVMTELDCHVFFNYLLDESGEGLQLNAYGGIPAEAAARIAHLGFGGSVCACVARDGMRRIEEDVQRRRSAPTRLIRSFGVQAYCCHPLLARGKVIGTLSFGTRSRPTFSSEDVGLMQTVASQVASAMQRLMDERELRAMNESLERRIAERTVELLKQRDQLRQAAEDLTVAEDRERARLADILHDDLGQSLAVAKLKVSALEAGLNMLPAAASLAELKNLLAQCIARTRDLTFELCPPALERGALRDALQWLAADVGRRHGLAVTVDADPLPRPVSPGLCGLVFRSVRELLFNVVKHSGSATAVVELRRRRGSLEVSVNDQGRGFEPARLYEANEGPGGFGLFSIRERIEHAGGRIGIASRPGSGSRITLTIPYAESEDGPDRRTA